MADDKKTGEKMNESEIDQSKGGKGEKAFTDEPAGEVEGRQGSKRVICWRCGAINRVPSWWTWFYCWACGALNRCW